MVAVTSTLENMSIIVRICVSRRSSYCAISEMELSPLKYLTRLIKVSSSALFLCSAQLMTAASSTSESSSFSWSKLTSSEFEGEVTVGVLEGDVSMS